MLKRFLNGLIAGTGVGVGFLAVLVVGLKYVVPNAIDEPAKEPHFENPKKAELALPSTDLAAVSKNNYSFYKLTNDYRMEIPDGGGVLAMYKVATPGSSERTSTYQLWLTHTELWQIRTLGEEAEVEMLSYPEGDAVEALDAHATSGIGTTHGRLTMAIAEQDVLLIRAGKPTPRQNSVNGKFKVTEDGVIFVIPDPYAT